MAILHRDHFMNEVMFSLCLSVMPFQSCPRLFLKNSSFWIAWMWVFIFWAIESL